MSTAIRQATEQRCREEQDEARCSAFFAERYITRGLLGRACQEQREVAYHHEQVRVRLERLIGVS